MELPPDITIIDTIRENQRFATYCAEYYGRRVFVKQVRHPDLTKSIRKELWGLQTFTELAETSHFPFELPEIITFGKDYVITSWAKGDHPKFVADKTETSKSEIQFFAESLVAVDSVARFVNPRRPKFDTPGRQGQRVDDRLRARLKPVPYQQYFDENVIESSFGFLAAGIADLEAAFTHGDFTPNNILDNNGIRTLTDFESCSLRWPRFYDLVNLTYNRMIMEPVASQVCVGIARRYFEINKNADIGESKSQLNTIAMVRSLSMINELITEPDAYHNTTQVMTLEIAERLKACMGAILSNEVYFTALS